MVVNDFDIMGCIVLPDKANAPLVIDPDTVLTGTVAPEQLQPVARRYPQIIEPCRHLQLLELSQRRPLDVHPALDTFALKECLRVGADE